MTAIIVLSVFCALLLGLGLGWWLGVRYERGRQTTTEDAWRTTFQALAAEQLNQTGDRFVKLADERQKLMKEQLDSHQKSVGELMKPLAERLQQFDQQRQEMYGKLTNELRRVTEANEKLRSETGNLVTALRRPHVRGRWGETTLRRVVELAGMVPYVDFVEQESTTTEAGRLRPDMTVRLPNGRCVVVDSKVALEAYIEATEQKDDAAREAQLQRHARQMREHMRQLSQKQYWAELSEGTEFVVMFVPGEHFLAAALEHDGSLMDDAMQNRVVIATPSTLIALLRAIEYGWRQASVEENAREISRLGRDLYSRINSFLGHLQRVQKGLRSAVEAFNSAVGSFERQFLPQVRRFKELQCDDGNELKEPEQVESALRELPGEEVGSDE
jgi:DNA recombination protein RmuC